MAKPADLRLCYERDADGPVAIGDRLDDVRIIGFAFSRKSVPPDRLADRAMLEGEEDLDEPPSRTVLSLDAVPEAITRSGPSPVEALPEDWLRLAPSRVGDAFQQAVAARGEGGEFVIRLLDDVAKRSHRTWLVGGTVRDLLDHDLERPSNDLDFTGTVGPGELSEVAYRRRRRAGLTDHVWRVSPQLVCSLAPYDAPHERLLEYMPLNPKGRNACPPVWGGDLRADAATRDLTVNSLCYDHRQEIVIDPTGDGLAHLHARPRILATRNRTDDPVDQARLVLRFLKFCFRWEETDCTPIQDAVRVFPPDLAALIPEDRWNQIIRARDRCVPEGKRGEAELEIAERIGPAAVSLVRAVHKRTS